MRSDRHILYHVTAVDRAFKILDAGYIDPQCSTGKRAVSWFVTKSMVPWAIAHVMNRHCISLPNCVVLYAAVHPRLRIRTSRSGVWCCDRPCRIDDIELAGLWLDKAELKIYIPSGYARRGYRYGKQSI